MADHDQLLTPNELADRWDNKISTKTMANWRCAGKGPKYRRYVGKILYPLSEVILWENANQFGSTNSYRRPDAE